MPDPTMTTDSTTVSTPTGRPVRAAILSGAAALSVLLGAAGALAFDGDGPAAGATRSFLAQSGAAGEDCPERDGDAAEVALLRYPTLAQADPTTPAAGTDAEAELSVADVAERANPAVVTITILSGRPGETQAIPVGAGSGFIVDGEGHVVTNAHVVRGAEELSVEFFDGTTVSATVVGSDSFQDVAVIQLDLSGGEEVPGVVAFGDSSAVRPGEQVVSIGSSLGEFTNTVSDGTVGAVDRELYGLPNLIQHDAEIYPGNSGGPLLNLQGEVVGVNVAGIGGESPIEVAPARIGFAIASGAVQEIADQLIATGEVLRPYLGIEGQEGDGGQLVTDVQPGTPAEEAGLQVGDVITAVDDEPIEGRTSLSDLLQQRAPGDTVSLTIERDGDEQQVEVVLAQRPADL